MTDLQEQVEIKTRDVTADHQNKSGHADELNLLDLLIIVARRKKLILTVTASVTILALIVSLLIPNRYTAITTIMPPQQTQSTASMLMSQFAGSGLGSLAAIAGGGLGLKNPNDLYMGLLKSRTVEDAIIAQFGFERIYNRKLLSETRKALEDASNITSGKDGLINISFQDKDPRRSAEVANAYVDQLRALTKGMALSEASQRRIFFEQQVEEAKDDLARAETDLQQSEQKTGLIQPGSQSKAMIEAVAGVRAKIAAKEVQLRAMASFATEQNPDYILVRQELFGLRAEMAKLVQGQDSGKGDPLVATGKLPAVGLEYVRRYREVKYREALFEILAKQYEAAKLDEVKEAAVIQVVDRAVPPDNKSWPHRGIIVVVALVLGIVSGVVWALAAAVLPRAKENHHLSQQLAELKLRIGFGAHASDR